MSLIIDELTKLDLISSDRDQKKEIFSNFLLIISFLSAVIGLIFCLIKKESLLSIIIISSIGWLSLILWRCTYAVWDEVKIGFYVVLMLFIALTLINSYYLIKKKWHSDKHNQSTDVS